MPRAAVFRSMCRWCSDRPQWCEIMNTEMFRCSGAEPRDCWDVDAQLPRGDHRCGVTVVVGLRSRSSGSVGSVIRSPHRLIASSPRRWRPASEFPAGHRTTLNDLETTVDSTSPTRYLFPRVSRRFTASRKSRDRGRDEIEVTRMLGRRTLHPTPRRSAAVHSCRPSPPTTGETALVFLGSSSG